MEKSNENIKEIKHVIIDYREKSLIEKINSLLEIKTENLPIADIVFKTDNTIDYCIERKTLADLSSSIKDGRHTDQMKRILECVSSNKCIYLIEGIIPSVGKINNISLSTIYGTIINKMLRDGIFVVRTNNILESVTFIKELGNRYLEGKLNYKNEKTSIQYNVPRKKGDITIVNCFANQLANIPSISSVKVNAIQEKFKSIRELIIFLEKEDDKLKYLENIKLKNGRNLGKSSSTKILFFLGFNY